MVYGYFWFECMRNSLHEKEEGDQNCMLEAQKEKQQTVK